ncbi:MAG: copper resistance protein B [Gammaproteobacteria bacterium]
MQFNRLILLAVSILVGSVVPTVQAQDNSATWPSPVHDNTIFSKWMLDRLEYRDANAGNSSYWEGQAWIGSDINKLWLKTEGSRVNGTTDDAELEAYYSRAVAPFWDAQVGIRHEFSTADMPSRDWLGFGFQGLAPYLFEVDATAYVGNNGRSALRFKAEYDLLLTQRLVFMPEVEFNAYGKKDPEKMRGSGLSDASLTLRLRYDIRREFAPYIGIMWTQKYGGTADYARAAGDPASETFLLAGVRVWW